MEQVFLDEKTFDPAAANQALGNIYRAIDSNAKEQGGFLIPTGAVLPFGASEAPRGWLACDGAAVSRTKYKRLFDVIGTTFGVGDGSSTFNLPDINTANRFVRGDSTIGTTGGSSAHGHEIDSHNIATNTDTIIGGANRATNGSHNVPTANHIPPYITLFHIIKT